MFVSKSIIISSHLNSDSEARNLLNYSNHRGAIAKVKNSWIDMEDPNYANQSRPHKFSSVYSIGFYSLSDTLTDATRFSH